MATSSWLIVASGSSPRTWGTAGIDGKEALLRRFIPTHVGNSCRAAGRTRTSPVHPHARGEQGSTGSLWFPFFGSSPRTWGTADPRDQRRLQRRFIPTHVGNSIDAAGQAAQDYGSSPRTWGTGNLVGVTLPHRRFIPTHVGNSRPPARADAIPTVHPHARGEQFATMNCTGWIAGSSPRTWGTVVDQLGLGVARRFIPTHVGNR